MANPDSRIPDGQPRPTSRRSRYGVLSIGTSMAVTVLQGLNLAVTYWLLKRHWGAEHLGVWSLIISILMLGRLAEVGMGQSLVGLIPKALQRGGSDAARDIYATVVLVTIAVFMLLAWPIYGAGRALLVHNLPGEFTSESLSAFRIALAGFLFTNIGLTSASAANGLRKAHLGNIVAAIGTLANLVVAVALVEHLGVSALAWGYLASGIVTCLGGFAIVAYNLKLPLAIHAHFRPDILKEVIGFGLSMQVISIASALTDLAVKLSVTAAGGLVAAGTYELASRYVLFLRSLFATSQGYFGGVVSHEHHGNGNGASTVSSALRIAASLAVFFVVALMIGRSFVGHAWVGAESADFALFAVLLSAGWAANIVAAPVYFGFIGVAFLRPTAISQLILLAFSAASCALAAWLGAAPFMIAALFSASLLVSQLYLVRAGLRFWGLSTRTLAGNGMASILILGAVAFGLAYAMEHMLSPSPSLGILFLVALILGTAYAAVHSVVEYRVIAGARRSS